MAAVLVFLLVIVGLLLVVFLVKKVLPDYRFARAFPPVQPFTPILGHTPLFVGVSTTQAFRNINRCFASVDRVGKLFLGPKLVLLVNHPDLLQQLLTRTDLYDKPFFYDFLGLKHGLISERSSQIWKRTRRLLNPTFSTRILNGFLPIMDDCARSLVRQLRPLADGGTTVNMIAHTSQRTLEMIFRTTMGCKMEGRTGHQNFFRNLEFIQNSVGARVLNVNQYYERLYRLSSTFRQEQECRKRCAEFMDVIINERRRDLESNFDGLHQSSMIFLDQLLIMKRDDGTCFSDDEILNHIYTMIVAGHETSALTASYTCLLLAMHPKSQQKLVEEIREVFPDPSVDISLDSLRQLEYLECVLKESLRLIPVAPIIARETSNEIELDGVRIPSGQVLAFNYYSLHRRKEFWGETADRFDPDRFRPEAAKDRHPYAYLPFSGGSRNCIGARYAMNSLKIMMVRIVQKFEMKTKLRLDDLRMRFEISLKLDGTHDLQLVPRELYD